MWIFVYFKASPDHAPRVREALGALSARLTDAFGIQPALGLRQQPGAELQTWLECHELPASVDPVGYQATLQTWASQAGLDELAIGGRHVEVFQPVT